MGKYRNLLTKLLCHLHSFFSNYLHHFHLLVHYYLHYGHQFKFFVRYFLGNVSRVIIRPLGHSGKAKRGHLCFDAAFETGNLGRADLVGEFEYDLFLRPDTCNQKQSNLIK